MRAKNEIIKEIQEWSEEHGGRTPSGKILKEELDIPKWEWISYWTKITQLQREAGLSPHGFDKTKFTEDELCDLFIQRIRELGKWPSRDELDYKRRQDPNFPASGTFYDKLGLTKTGDLAYSLLKYIRDKQGYEDIVQMCKPYLNILATSENSLETKGVGYVYLKESKLKNSTVYKIGKTKDINNRIKQLHQPSNDEKLIHCIKTDDMEGIEKYWHQRFGLQRLYPDRPKDEWFVLSKSDIKAFKKWKRVF